MYSKNIVCQKHKQRSAIFVSNQIYDYWSKGTKWNDTEFLKANLPLSSYIWITQSDRKDLKINDVNRLGDEELERVIDWFVDGTKGISLQPHLK